MAEEFRRMQDDWESFPQQLSPVHARILRPSVETRRRLGPIHSVRTESSTAGPRRQSVQRIGACYNQYGAGRFTITRFDRNIILREGV
jgi:hypothetical protein